MTTLTSFDNPAAGFRLTLRSQGQACGTAAAELRHRRGSVCDTGTADGHQTPLFITKPHIEVLKHQYLYAFVHLAPPNRTITPLFTCYTPLLENVINHTYLLAFVQSHKT